MAERDLHVSSLVVGQKGTGKSTYTNKLARAYPADKKVLIFDVNGSPAYKDIMLIEPKDVKRLTRGVVRLLGTPTDETLDIVAKDFRGGLIIYEDCTKYISGNVPPLIKTFLVDHRMYQCDLVFTFHSLKRVPPFFWEMVSYITLFKTSEVFESGTNRNRIPNYEAILSAYKKAKASKDKYFNITVETLV